MCKGPTNRDRDEGEAGWWAVRGLRAAVWPTPGEVKFCEAERPLAHCRS